jgi:hypothetical protein
MEMEEWRTRGGRSVREVPVGPLRASMLTTESGVVVLERFNFPTSPATRVANSDLEPDPAVSVLNTSCWIQIRIQMLKVFKNTLQ